MAEGDAIGGNKSIILHLKDFGGQASRLVLTGVGPTLPLAKTFAAAQCGATVTGASEVKQLVCATVAGNESEDINQTDKKLKVTYRDNVTGKVSHFVIPAYLAGTASFQSGERGQRLTDTAGQTIVDAYKTATAGENSLKFLRGIPTRTT